MKEGRPGLGLFMGFPSAEKIAHDIGDIAPTIDLLRTAFGFNLEEPTIERALFLVITEAVIGVDRDLVDHFID